MSAALHRLARGASLGLGAPAGDFVLATDPAPRLLLVAGGSGITPIIAMIRDLTARRSAGAPQPDVVVIHASRGRHDAIFGDELASLATRFRWLQLHPRRGDDPTTGGRLDAAALRALVPDLADRETFVCGPPGLIDLVSRAADAAGALHRFHCERFVAPPLASPGSADAPAAPVTIALAHTGTLVVAAGSGSLLVQLERAGQRPAHGCRIGICHTCRCRKLRGTVEDSLTGAVSSEPDQDIRLCVSIARSDLELAL
jgi:ferredoxin-NADP reductase